jgi:hypothetical protein
MECPVLLSGFNRRRNIIKTVTFPSIKFHENLLSDCQAVTCRRTDGNTSSSMSQKWKLEPCRPLAVEACLPRLQASTPVTAQIRIISQILQPSDVTEHGEDSCMIREFCATSYSPCCKCLSPPPAGNIAPELSDDNLAGVGGWATRSQGRAHGYMTALGDTTDSSAVPYISFRPVIIEGCDYRRGIDWILDLLTHFYTPLGTTSN